MKAAWFSAAAVCIGLVVPGAFSQTGDYRQSERYGGSMYDDGRYDRPGDYSYSRDYDWINRTNGATYGTRGQGYYWRYGPRTIGTYRQRPGQDTYGDSGRYDARTGRYRGGADYTTGYTGDYYRTGRYGATYDQYRAPYAERGGYARDFDRYRAVEGYDASRYDGDRHGYTYSSRFDQPYYGRDSQPMVDYRTYSVPQDGRYYGATRYDYGDYRGRMYGGYDFDQYQTERPTRDSGYYPYTTYGEGYRGTFDRDFDRYGDYRDYRDTYQPFDGRGTRDWNYREMNYRQPTRFRDYRGSFERGTWNRGDSDVPADMQLEDYDYDGGEEEWEYRGRDDRELEIERRDGRVEYDWDD